MMFAADSAMFSSCWKSEFADGSMTNKTGLLVHRSSPDSPLPFGERNDLCASSVRRKITVDTAVENETPAGMSHEDSSPASKCEARCRQSSPMYKKKHSLRKEARMIQSPRRRDKSWPAKASPSVPPSCGKMWIRHIRTQHQERAALSPKKTLDKSIAIHERAPYSPYQGIHAKKSQGYSPKAASVGTSSDSRIDMVSGVSFMVPSGNNQRDDTNAVRVPSLYSSPNLSFVPNFQRPRPTMTFGESGRLLKPVRHSMCYYLPNRTAQGVQEFLLQY